MQFKVVIPARYASTRLPGKPLLEIAGKPMVVHVVEKAIASGAQQVVVATDDQRIYDAVSILGYEVVMTSDAHQSGTDRIAEVAKLQNWQDDEIVVNVQGDEPLIEPSVIRAVAQRLIEDNASVAATACFRLNGTEAFLNPNNVKVVLSETQHALYFSRAPIPFPRDEDLSAIDHQAELNIKAYQHVGLYAYRVGFLATYTTLPMVSLERIEKLEQLRILAHGYQMVLHIVETQPEPGVDTEEDLAAVRQKLA